MIEVSVLKIVGFASFALLVVLPEPCRPASSITAGGATFAAFPVV